MTFRELALKQMVGDSMSNPMNMNTSVGIAVSSRNNIRPSFRQQDSEPMPGLAAIGTFIDSQGPVMTLWFLAMLANIILVMCLL